MILQCFDHAFVINADIHADRYAQTTERLAEVGIAATRLPAIFPTDAGCYSSTGKRGCVASHLAVIKAAKEHNYSSVLVLEDDVVFQTGFLQYWAKLLPQLSAIEYDIFYFYRWREAGRTPDNLRILHIMHTLCTHAYAVHARFYDKYISIFEEAEINCTGTSADRRFTAENARIYAPSYNLVGQDANVSSITGQSKSIRFQDRFEDGLKE